MYRDYVSPTVTTTDSDAVVTATLRLTTLSPTFTSA